MNSAREKIPLEICILAGGLSSRMGRDKSRLRIGGKTILARIRETADALDFPVRVIRRDVVERCGPLGGIFTALKTTRATSVLFLACDMPHVSETLLRLLIEKSGSPAKPIFTWNECVAGFPFLLSREMLESVGELIAQKNFSLQTLAGKTRAKKFRPPEKWTSELLNLNTPEELKLFKKSLPQSRAISRSFPVLPK